MAGLIYETDYNVRPINVSQNLKFDLPTMVSEMIDCSGQQTDKLHGREGDPAEQEGLTWVLVQYLLKIDRLPDMHEDIILGTQPTQYNRFFAYRDFWIKDQAGDRIVEMHSVFALMDMKTRKLARMKDAYVEHYGTPKIKNLVRMPKVSPVDKEEAFFNDYRVRFFDIDYNRHVNNANYLIWSLDVLPEDFLLSHELKNLNITFEKEIYYGDTIRSFAEIEEKEGGLVVTRHSIETEGQANSHVECEWLKIKND